MMEMTAGAQMEKETKAAEEAAVVVENLVKRYRVRKKDGWKTRRETITAVNGLSLAIKKGEIYGLIGPNGAGKTTTLKILSTLVLPDGGTCTVLGKDVVREAAAVRKIIGVSVGEFTRALYWRLTGLENLVFFAKLRGIKNPKERAEELIHLMGLEEWKNERVMKYSTGMKHKLSIAAALIHDPPILFLDEPLTGIDPVTAYQIKRFIKEHLSDRTIIWTSHNLYEIEEMCDRIGLLRRGRLVLEGPPEELKRNHWDYEKLVIVTPHREVFLEIDGARPVKNGVVIETRDMKKTLVHVGEILQRGVDVAEIHTVRPTLEEVFMKHVEEEKRGRKIEEEKEDLSGREKI